MSSEPTRQQSPEQRAESCVSAMVEQGFLWGLFQDKDWVMVLSEDDACAPLWPSAQAAKDWQENYYPKASIRKLPLDQWHSKWQNNLAKDNCLLLLYPLLDDDEGILVTPQEFSQFVEEGLNQ